MFIYLGQKYLGGHRGRDRMVVGFTKQCLSPLTL